MLRRTFLKSALTLAALSLSVAAGPPVQAQDLLVRKQVFELPSFTTQSGRALRNVRVGWESYGELNADRSNAILICHFFSGTSHAAGKYAATDAAPGYWDAIIGPGKAIDTNRYFVLSVDTLVNLNTGDPLVTTTGPATPDPNTGRPYGSSFPVVTIRDFVEVQRALLDSLGVNRLHMVAGPSMGALQTYEWAAAYPERVGRIMPVIGTPGADGNLIGWLDIWASPIRLDPNFRNGDYYGREPPAAGLAQAFKVLTLHANHGDWVNATFGRKPAAAGADPAAALDNRFAIETTLDAAGAARAKMSDANHFLYLVKANQTAAPAIERIKAPVLLISSLKDLVFTAAAIDASVKAMREAGIAVTHVTLEGTRGHLDGVLSMKQAERAVAEFVNR